MRSMLLERVARRSEAEEFSGAGIDTIICGLRRSYWGWEEELRHVWSVDWRRRLCWQPRSRLRNGFVLLLLHLMAMCRINTIYPYRARIAWLCATGRATSRL